MRTKRTQNAFTFVELMIVIAITAVLISVAVPSFSNAVKTSQISSAMSCLNFALLNARSESVRRSADVSMCARATSTTCGTDWSNGALVFTESSAATIADPLATAILGADSEVLKVCSPIHGNLEIVVSASDSRNAADAKPRNYIRFNRRGTTNWGAGFIGLCDDRDEENWRTLNLGLNGQVQSGRFHNEGDARIDAFNRKFLSCK